MLTRQGCHNSDGPITVDPELKRYLRNSQTNMRQLKTTTETDGDGRRRTDTLRETLHDGLIVFQDHGFSGS